MPSNKLKPSRLTITGLCSILTILSLVTACNLTQAQEQHSQNAWRERRSERLMRRDSRATNSTSNTGKMVLESLSHQGRTRSYYVYIPSSYQPDKPMPVVMAFHGGAGQGDTMAEKTGLNEVAQRGGFIAVYPNSAEKSRGGRWNDGRNSSAINRDTDDVGFVGAIIDRLSQEKNIDSQRIYATGGSNGGFFTQRLACEMSNRIAAFASVSATLPAPLQSTCNPRKGVPILMINGTADPFVPWQGGQVKIGAGGQVLSVPETVQFWRNRDSCSSNSAVEQLPNSVSDGTEVTKAQYSGCRNSARVVFYTVQGGGHGWPGSRSRRRGDDSEGPSGKISRDINASDVIWNFFKPQTLQ